MDFNTLTVSMTGDNPPSAIKTFAAAGLGAILMDNVNTSGYSEPTRVQKYAIPIISAGRDLMVCARTGSGKTASYLLPIINKLVETGETLQAPQCVVITATKELAIEVYNEARRFAEGSTVRSVVADIGTSVGDLVGQLQQGCNILVVTPGRLLEFVEKGFFVNCKYLVLDEAVKMLDMGFMPEIKKMFKDPAMPKTAPEGYRQTLMISATLPDEYQEGAQEILTDYICLCLG